jgi:hypothetical protein
MAFVILVMSVLMTFFGLPLAALLLALAWMTLLAPALRRLNRCCCRSGRVTAVGTYTEFRSRSKHVVGTVPPAHNGNKVILTPAPPV